MFYERLILFSASSARDQLTNQAVAVKKIMKPFSTPVLAKRTYRELKLLKHLRHENVCLVIIKKSFAAVEVLTRSRVRQIITLSDIFISPLEDLYVFPFTIHVYSLNI